MRVLRHFTLPDSLCFERRNQTSVIRQHNSASVAHCRAPESLCESWGQRPCPGSRQPQPQQVTSTSRVRPILEGSPIVQDGVVVDQLHVTWLEFHGEMEARIICELIPEVQSSNAFGRKPWSGRETLG